MKVSATQYALCLDGGLCSAYCQTKERKAAGVCAGPTNWDCYCEDGDGNREAGKQASIRERGFSSLRYSTVNKTAYNSIFNVVSYSGRRRHGQLLTSYGMKRRLSSYFFKNYDKGENKIGNKNTLAICG